VPIYDFACGCGARFERILPMAASTAGDGPGCPACGAATSRVPSRPALSGQVDVGRPAALMPQTWRGTYGADRDYVTHLRRDAERRQSLEAKHPQLAGDRRPVLAHEGRYEAVPLRAGDTPAAPPSSPPTEPAAQPHTTG
jgi:putative FmdB family regulatory protein